MKRAAISTILTALLAAGMAGCGEREQTTSYRDGKFRGKPDDRPWESDWAKGNRENWERQIRERGDTQNENRRIGQ